MQKNVRVALETGLLVDSSTSLAILYVNCSVRMKSSSEVYFGRHERVSCPHHPYVRAKKYCMQCFFSVQAVRTGSVYRPLYSVTSRIPQMQRRFCVTDKAGVQPIGRGQSLRPRTLTRNQTATRRPGLPFDGGLHPQQVITWITTTHLPTPEGWKAELAWLAHPYWTVYLSP